MVYISALHAFIVYCVCALGDDMIILLSNEALNPEERTETSGLVVWPPLGGPARCRLVLVFPNYVCVLCCATVVVVTVL